MFHRIFILTIASCAMFITACEPDTPGERIADSVENIGDEMRDTAENVGNDVEDACEELKQEAGAKDTDC